MSKVFSFRLREDNPREVQAQEVIEVWISQGYSLRHILTEALIRYDNDGDHGEEVANLIEQLRSLLTQTSSERIARSIPSDNKSALPSHFIEAVKKSMKSGERI